MYFLGFSREQVCEPGTQLFFWKVAKNLLNEDFITKMAEYDFRGSKDGEFKKYQTINYIEKVIAGIEQKDVDDFNFVAGRLFSWLKQAIEARKLDIVRRNALIQKQRDDRESKIKAKEEQEKKRESDLDEAKKKFEEDHKEEIDAFNEYQKKKDEGKDEYGEEEEEETEKKEEVVPTMPVFNEEEFLEGWAAENPAIEIAEETKDDVDNDWIVSQEELADEIKKFWAKGDA